MSRLTREVAVVGVGYSALSRGGDVDRRKLTLDATRAAIADAGLVASDLDGIVQYQYLTGGHESPTVSYVQRMLGIENLDCVLEVHSGPTGVSSVMAGVVAVASGACDTVLAYRTLPQREGTTGVSGAPVREIGGPNQFSAIYGHGAAILANYAMKKRLRIAELGGSVEDYGLIAINARRWAALNDRAVMRQQLTMDDYLAARVVVDPLLLLDCDYPIDGSAALVITTRERARDLPHPPVYVDAIASGTGTGADFVFGDDFLFGGSIHCARRLWSQSSLAPADVDFLALYDGFTHLPISWVEAFGFCGIGEFRDWVDGGRTIGPGGSLPINTSGGMLAEGRLQGIGIVAEAVNQLRGECGERQVPGASVAAVGGGGSNDCGAMLLRNR